MIFNPAPTPTLAQVCAKGNTTSTDLEITDASKGIILINTDSTRLRLTEDTDANNNRLVQTTL